VKRIEKMDENGKREEIRRREEGKNKRQTKKEIYRKWWEEMKGEQGYNIF
jgi:hypothetical protein